MTDRSFIIKHYREGEEWYEVEKGKKARRVDAKRSWTLLARNFY